MISIINYFIHFFYMRLQIEEILYELKLRLKDEKSIKKKVLLKQLIDLINQL